MRLALCLLIIATNCLALADEKDLIESYLKIACVHPCRVLDGKTIDLTPKFNHVRNVFLKNHDDGNMNACKEWSLIIGKVFQIADDGLLVKKYRSYDWLLDGEWELVLIRNDPGASRVVDDSIISCFAAPDGRYSYVSTQGARKTILAFDHGIVCTNVAVEAAAPKPEPINIIERIIRQSGTRSKASFQTNIDGVMCTFKCADSEDRARVRDAVMDLVGAYSGTISPPVITFKIPDHRDAE